MSHMVTRKGSVGEDKEKRQTDSPVKEMKKKIAANAEKEKIAAEKTTDKATDKSQKAVDKKDKGVDKQADKASEKKDKSAEKHAEKPAEKKDKNPEKNVEKAVEKKDKSAEKSVEKSAEKPAEKKEKPIEKASDKKEKTDKKEVAEKPKGEASTADKGVKGEKPEEKGRKQETAKLNGGTQNGQNGAASSSDDDELVIVEQPDDNDEMFPELAYDDNSDADGFEPDLAASRSLTRRSQVKATRTPETPRPASAAQQQRDPEHSKEPKLLRLKEDAALTERRLRSANSPKPGNDSPKKAADTPEGQQAQQGAEKSEKVEKAEKAEKTEMEVVIEMESSEDGDAVRRDTRYSRSRVKVSPYRRSARLADASHASIASHTSLMANYTGNNTTMEMDITEPSITSEGTSPPPSPSPDDSYLSGLRTIRGRRSYKQSHAQPHAHVQAAYVHAKAHAQAQAHAHAQAQAQAANVTAATAGRDTSRPTGTVVGRKRRPDAAEEVEEASEVTQSTEAPKRPRLLERLARPFRTHSTPLPARRAAEIVGINTDLPLSAPVAAADSLDPETIKTTPTPTISTIPAPTPTLCAIPTPTPSYTSDSNSKRCAVM